MDKKAIIVFTPNNPSWIERGFILATDEEECQALSYARLTYGPLSLLKVIGELPIGNLINMENKNEW